MASRKTSLIRVTPTNADDVTVTRSLPRTNSSRKLSRNKLSLSQTLPSNELFVRRRTSCISLPATTQSFGRKSSTAESIAERASATEPDGPKGGGDRRDSCQRRGPVGGGAGPSRRRESAALPDASALAAAGGGAKREGRRVSLNADGKMGEGGGGAGFRGRRTSTDEVDAHFANLRGARRSTDASSSLLVDPAPRPPGGEWGDDDVESIGSDDAVPPPDI